MTDGTTQHGWTDEYRLLIFFKFHEESDSSHGKVGPSDVGQIDISSLITTCYLNEKDIAILSASFQRYIFFR